MNTGKKIFLAIGVVICLLGLSYFLYTNFQERKSSDSMPEYESLQSEIISSNTEPTRINLVQDALLHLYSMDEKYVSLLAASSAASTLDSLQRSILRTEKMLLEMVDSLYATKNVDADHRTARFFKNVINNRSLLRFEQNSAATPSTSESYPSNDRNLQMLLLRKNEEIIALQEQLASAAVSEGKPGTEDGEPASASRLKTMEQAYMELQRKYSVLEQSHNNVSRRFADADNTDGETSSTLSSAREKINDLEVLLRFAQVDCNLTRADGRSIISNSKQRNALLGESLKILNSLSNNENKAVQKKAKDKLAELNHIASTVRD